jgi:hypothetical protein
MAIAVKHIHEGMRGAPVLSGTVGSLIALIDAFLLSGWGLVTATGITVAGGIATVSLNAGETFEEGSVVLVAGATPAALNGEQRVLTASATSITFATTAADGAASGTITVKYAPQGSWEKTFSGTNLAVYRSTDVTGARMYYRVQDTSTTAARIVGYVSMTGVSTGTGPFPTSAQRSGGSYWPKSTIAGSAPIPYLLAADGRAVLASICAGAANGAGYVNAPVCGFGELLGLATAGDAWASVVAFPASDWAFNPGPGCLSGGYTDAVFMARAHTGTGASAAVKVASYCQTPSVGSGADPMMGAYPSAVDGRLLLSRRFVGVGAADATPRAEVPGLLSCPQDVSKEAFVRLDKVVCAGDLAGRTLRATRTVDNAIDYPVVDFGSKGVAFIDTTGPWRPAA